MVNFRKKYFVLRENAGRLRRRSGRGLKEMFQ